MSQLTVAVFSLQSKSNGNMRHFQKTMKYYRVRWGSRAGKGIIFICLLGFYYCFYDG